MKSAIIAIVLLLVSSECHPKTTNIKKELAKPPYTGETDQQAIASDKISRLFKYNKQEYLLYAKCKPLNDSESDVWIGLLHGTSKAIIFNTKTTTASTFKCEELVSFDEDFNDDGIPDVAIMNAPQVAEVTQQIYLLGINEGTFYKAGNLPVDVEPDGNGIFIATEFTGSSKFTTKYIIAHNKIHIGNTYELLMDGAVCLNSLKGILERDSCESNTALVTASPDAPLCILHRKHSTTVVSTFKCH